jgi:hypothetical protein
MAHSLEVIPDLLIGTASVPVRNRNARSMVLLLPAIPPVVPTLVNEANPLPHEPAVSVLGPGVPTPTSASLGTVVGVPLMLVAGAVLLPDPKEACPMIESKDGETAFTTTATAAHDTMVELGLLGVTTILLVAVLVTSTSENDTPLLGPGVPKNASSRRVIEFQVTAAPVVEVSSNTVAHTMSV